MKKIHTKVKRKYGLSTAKNQYRFFHPVEKPHRPRTFADEAKAKEWAKAQGLKEGQYSVKSVKNNKRFQIVPLKKA